MEQLTLDQIKALAQHLHKPSISIYLPTHRVGQDSQQDPIRFKNLLREAEHRLEAEDHSPREIAALLQPAHSLLNDAAFWRHVYDGLAVFIAPNDFHTFRLPFTTSERLIFAQHYYIKPMLPLFTNNGHYYILAFSQNEVRLLEGTRHSIGEIDLPEGIPTSLEEALQYDDPEKQLQFHTGTAQGGMRASMVHGHGPGDEEQKERIKRYLNLLDAGLTKFLNQQPAPLVLAGVDYLHPIYHEVTNYPHVVQKGVTGSPEHLRPDELQAAAWPIVEPQFSAELEKVKERYQEVANTTKNASADLSEIVSSAFYGRVDSLLIATDSPQYWGEFDHETGAVTHHKEGENGGSYLALADYAAMQTLLNSGKVYALPSADMPNDAPLAAIFRY